MSEYSERDIRPSSDGGNEPDFDIYEGPHVCREGTFCTCDPVNFGGYEYSCPVHGLGPPRCGECGRYMPRSDYYPEGHFAADDGGNENPF